VDPRPLSVLRAAFSEDRDADSAVSARIDRRIALALFLAAFAVRVAAALQVRVIAQDGVRFLAMARQFGTGEFAEGLREVYHPLYPASIALLRPLTGGYETAALAVSVIASSLGLLFLWGFLRPLFGRRAAVAACASYAFLSPFVRFGADTLSEGLFLSLLLLGLYAGARGFREKKPLFEALAGAAAAAAYLTRPEGMGLLLAFGLFFAVLLAAGFEGRGRARIALSGLLVLGGFLIAAAPYLVHLRVETGRWDLSRKKSVSSLADSLEEKIEGGREIHHPSSRVMSIPEASATLTLDVLGNFFYIPAALALLGLAWPWPRGERRPWRWELLVLLAAGAWAAACLALLRANGYVSHRHSIAIALFLLGHSGRGAVLLAEGAGLALERIPGWRPRASGRRVSAAFLGFLVAFAFVAGCPANFRPFRADKVFEIEIARDVAGLVESGTAVAGDLPRVSYYAGRGHVAVFPGCDLEQFLALARAEGAGLLVFEEDHFRTWAPDLHAALSGPGRPPVDLSLARTWNAGPHGRKVVRAYRITLP